MINSAGLQANDLARTIRGLDARHVPPLYFAKGNYFSVSRARAVQPPDLSDAERSGLGVHLTIDLGGQARFGPDVEWVDAINYDVDPHRADSFYAAIRAYWPRFPTMRCSPLMRGFVRSFPARASPPPTS